MDRMPALSGKLFQALCVLLVILQVLPFSAMQGQSAPLPPPSTAAQKVMEEVHKIPIGGKLTVLKTDGTQYHGHLQAMTAQDFTLTEVDRKQTFTLPYSEVGRVRKNYGGKGFGGRRVDPRKN